MPDGNPPTTMPASVAPATQAKKPKAFLSALLIAVFFTIGLAKTPFLAPTGEGAIAIWILTPFIFVWAVFVNWGLVYLIRRLWPKRANTKFPVYIVAGLNIALFLYQLTWYYRNPQ